jgi:hypothetical protein
MKHPFRLAIESGATGEEFSAIFAPNVVLMAPMLTKPLSGVSDVLNVVRHAAAVAGPIKYVFQASDTKQTFLLWKGEVDGHSLEAVTILVDDENGLISEIRVLMRPWPVSTLFRDQMYELLSDDIPAEYWELGPRQTEDGSPREFTPIALKPLSTSPDMVLHSPMLAKSVSGKAEVKEAVRLAHEVQSRSSYTSIIATPELIIELFDCDADGYPMEGMWVQKLNEDGEVCDLTVLLRPYPAVTVLRNKTKAMAEETGFLGDEYWTLPSTP